MSRIDLYMTEMRVLIPKKADAYSSGVASFSYWHPKKILGDQAGKFVKSIDHWHRLSKYPLHCLHSWDPQRACHPEGSPGLLLMSRFLITDRVARDLFEP